MKRLVGFLLVLGVTAFFVRSSVYWSLLQLHRGLDEGDLDTVVRYADLKSLAEVPVDLSVAAASAVSKDAAGIIGETLVKALGGAIGQGLKQVGGQLAAQELAERIKKRELLTLLGGFRPASGLGWFGGTHSLAEFKVVTIVGTCRSRDDQSQRVEVRVGLTFSPSSGPYAGYPVDWRAMGLDAESAEELVRQCALTF